MERRPYHFKCCIITFAIVYLKCNRNGRGTRGRGRKLAKKNNIAVRLEAWIETSALDFDRGWRILAATYREVSVDNGQFERLWGRKSRMCMCDVSCAAVGEANEAVNWTTL